MLCFRLKIKEILCKHFLNRYSAITTDVLTSIKKTEDSLLRLKRTRKAAGGQGAQSGPGSGTDGSTTMTDDDKIRLQFVLDVTDFGKIVSC